MNDINIEIYCAPNCQRCGRTVELVQEIVTEMDNHSIQWQKLNVVDEIDKAVSLGILATPAIVINGKLEFIASPDKKTLKNKIEEFL